mmetsp:Transcript_32915/g.57576  ORF Transcript_32915/g.57576 Transcript_32915/m.57576 type:complete len:200 (-) Transcript_32915:53-652(-)
MLPLAWKERLRTENRESIKFLKSVNFDYLLRNLKHYEARLRVKSRQFKPSGLHKSESAPVINDTPVDYSKFNRTAATPGEHRGKYSRKLLFVTTQLPSSRGFHSSVTSSPTRPSTAELARRSMIRCASLSDGFTRAIKLKDESRSGLVSRLAIELEKLRPSTSLANTQTIPDSLKNSPYLQKFQRKGLANHRAHMGRTM